MNPQLIMVILKSIYGPYLRAVLVQAVESTDNEIDNFLVELLDSLLG